MLLSTTARENQRRRSAAMTTQDRRAEDINSLLSPAVALPADKAVAAA